jgi:hypothetical protein
MISGINDESRSDNIICDAPWDKTASSILRPIEFIKSKKTV